MYARSIPLSVSLAIFADLVSRLRITGGARGYSMAQPAREIALLACVPFPLVGDATFVQSSFRVSVIFEVELCATFHCCLCGDFVVSFCTIDVGDGK